MNFFNSNAFVLGALVFLGISLGNFAYVWLCKIWKVKITEFSIFVNPWFSLIKKDINGTVYKLGWLPIGAYIKPLGMEGSEGIAEEELPWSFSNLSGKKQLLFRFTPTLVWLLILLVSLLILKGPGNFVQAVSEVFNYIVLGLKTILGYTSKSDFVDKTKLILIDKNIIAFALILLISVYFVLAWMSKLMTISYKNEKEVNWLIKAMSFLVAVIGVYMTFGRIPAFVFSFFPLARI